MTTHATEFRDMQIGEVVVYGDEVLINKPGREWESAYFQGFDDYTITPETPHKFRRPVQTAKQLNFWTWH